MIPISYASFHVSFLGYPIYHQFFTIRPNLQVIVVTAGYPCRYRYLLYDHSFRSLFV